MTIRHLIAFLILTQSNSLFPEGLRFPFNADWQFSNGSYSAETSLPGFDAAGWQAVDLPHDWAIAGPFDPEKNGYAGKLPWEGEGWYRKVFHVDSALAGRQVYFDFDGVMAFPRVHVNGTLVGEWDYGYNGFRVDATAAIRFGEENVISVRATTENWGTRWYPGAGIYRKVTMAVLDPVHIRQWGVFVTAEAGEPGGPLDRVMVRTLVENHGAAAAEVVVESVVSDPAGRVVAAGANPLRVDGRGFAGWGERLVVENPLLWDVDHPHLYTVRVVVKRDGAILDTQETTFGFRTFSFTADDGFHLNGRRVQLRGVNLHHDLGPLGAAFNKRAAQRQLEIMKDMGINALRTSHNPPAPEVLDLCDRMGILVWDEVFDKWDHTAGRVGDEPPLPEFSRRQIHQTVQRDRNHPSVVVWSVANEVAYGDQGMSAERVAYMSAYVRELDTTRPVGMGCHIPAMVAQGHFEALELAGWNYNRRYAEYRVKYPDRPVVYTESASALSTRGFYALPLARRKTDYAPALQVDSYDLNAAAWADIPDVEFALMEQDRFVAGEFVWTGFDYIGEPTPFDAEARSSYFGIVDLCGIPKDRYYLYRSHWRPDHTTIHILPHWNWPERVGRVVPVFVYTNGDSAELFLNGKSLGMRRKGDVPPKPANLAAAGIVTSGAGSGGEWWQVDLLEPEPVGFLALAMEGPEKLYAYTVKASVNGKDWETIVTKPTSDSPKWGGVCEVFHTVEAVARYLRVEITGLRDEGVVPAIRKVAAYAKPVESDYYNVTYRYRLRWNEVVYQPGELKVVAYKDGQVLGEQVMRTAGKPQQLRLTPDRTTLLDDGGDLSFILVEALDEAGVPCPLADNLVRFALAGPADIAAVGNGNPLSLEPFQADYRRLFNGKAMLIVRSRNRESGTVTVTAAADGLQPAEAVLSIGD